MANPTNNSQIRVIWMQKWKSATFRRSKVPYIILLIVYQVTFIVFSYIGLSALIYIFERLELLGTLATLYGVVLLINLILSLYSYLSWVSYRYILESAKVKIVGNSTFDPVPSKIKIENGVFSRSLTNVGVMEFNRVEMYQSLFGKIFDYGDIYLESVADLRESGRYRLSAVKKPMQAMRKIQQMIDTSSKETQSLI